MPDSPYFAAIDLGSNSFHMLIARIDNGQLDVIDREKEMVQIARGLDDNGNIDDSAKQRAMDCLHRFSERLRNIPKEQIRAVGTKTLRSAKKSTSFLKQAEKQLGAPIQIISGYEEARLVYCGFSHSLANDGSPRLVADIGGGSTEFIIGENHEPNLLESLSLGCVAYTNRYFKSEKTFSENMNKAYLAACDELETIRKSYTKHGWQTAYGTSGTIKAIGELVSGANGAVIDYGNLTTLMHTTMEQGGIKDKNITKLRRDVLPAGIAILKAIFDQLKIETMQVSTATLKEGLIFDTVGRSTEDDIREITVKKLLKQYNVDIEQAKRVEKITLQLWSQIKKNQPNIPGISRTKIVRWAALLHEIGLNISHSSYHHHGHYLLQHSDLAGFGKFEQYVISLLVQNHRKKIRLGDMDTMEDSFKDAFLPLLLCLRLAVRLARRREDLKTSFTLTHKENNFILDTDDDWLKLNPLTRASLLNEIKRFEDSGLSFTLNSSNAK